MSEQLTGVREKNVSMKKLPIVQSASFDTLIEAIRTKSDKAQCTFLHRLIGELSGDVLQTMNRYASKEIKRRAGA